MLKYKCTDCNQEYNDHRSYINHLVSTCCEVTGKKIQLKSETLIYNFINKKETRDTYPLTVCDDDNIDKYVGMARTPIDKSDVNSKVSVYYEGSSIYLSCYVNPSTFTKEQTDDLLNQKLTLVLQNIVDTINSTLTEKYTKKE